MTAEELCPIFYVVLSRSKMCNLSEGSHDDLRLDVGVSLFGFEKIVFKVVKRLLFFNHRL